MGWYIKQITWGWCFFQHGLLLTPLAMIIDMQIKVIIWQMIHCADYDFCEYILILMKHLKGCICLSPCLAIIYANISEALTLDRNIY